MDKRIVSKRIFRYLVSIFFACFMALYLSQSFRYVEYENRKQVALTEKQIQKFEKDVKEGKAVDINTYFKKNKHDYQNKISKTGLKISKTAGGAIKIVVEKSFKVLSKLGE